ncbi:MAG: hypothetical protein LVT47_11645 [Cyanobacteria bacterium LVE1205-1]|jgi:hypothetical protein
MQPSTEIDDSYLDDYSFGSDAGEDVLLLIVASLTPIVQDDDMPTDKNGESIYTNAEDCALTQAGLEYAGGKLHDLLNALTKPFNDDDCSYGGEYYEGEMTSPMRFLSPRQKKGYNLVTDFKWLPPGGEIGEEEDGILFFDSAFDNNYKTAFFVSLSRGTDPSGYLLYWNHVEPYLSGLDQVFIAAYNDEAKRATLQEYYNGEIDEEHDATYADRWIDNLLLTKKEICTFRQTKIADTCLESEAELQPQEDLTPIAKPMLKGKALLEMVDSGQFPDKSALVKACGYTSISPDGREIICYTAFFEAMTEAKSSSESEK